MLLACGQTQPFLAAAHKAAGMGGTLGMDFELVADIVESKIHLLIILFARDAPFFGIRHIGHLVDRLSFDVFT